jgi:hypothetical protein
MWLCVVVLTQDRIRLAYRSSLGYFYRFPEVWQEFAQYELETGAVYLML